MPAPKGGMVRSPGGCLRCGHSVYEAEKLIAAGRVSKTAQFPNQTMTSMTIATIFQSWHKRCFTCSVCNRHLDSTTVNDGTDGDIYCRTCYASKFGMKGYGYGQGAGTLMSVSVFTYKYILHRCRLKTFLSGRTGITKHPHCCRNCIYFAITCITKKKTKEYQ